MIIAEKDVIVLRTKKRKPCDCIRVFMPSNIHWMSYEDHRKCTCFTLCIVLVLSVAFFVLLLVVRTSPNKNNEENMRQHAQFAAMMNHLTNATKESNSYSDLSPSSARSRKDEDEESPFEIWADLYNLTMR